MKYTLLTFFCIAFHSCAFSQTNGPVEITPAVLNQMNAQVAKEVISFHKTLTTRDLSALEINFALDTFRIERLTSLRINADYSTVGMNKTVGERSASYDKLLNKYYNFLMGVLKVEDRKILVSAQRGWLAFRNGEQKLIATMAKKEYSGGGSIQSNIANERFADLVVQRTLKIFNYYNDIMIKDGK